MYQDVCLHMLWPLCILVYAYVILIAIIYLLVITGTIMLCPESDSAVVAYLYVIVRLNWGARARWGMHAHVVYRTSCVKPLSFARGHLTY